MTTSLLGVRIDPTDYSAAASRVLDWVAAGESRYICVANAHVLMEAHDSEQFAAVLNGADLVVPDGMPLVWALRLRGFGDAQRVYGPNLMGVLLKEAAAKQLRVGLYGSTPTVMELLLQKIKARYLGLDVVYHATPPFRGLTTGEDDEICRQIEHQAVHLLFVGLGCPKQETWMAAHRGRLNAVMLGVGAAFDFLAGTKPQAPAWMQASGLEWLFRLLHEPRRLARRYLVQNPRFAFLAAAELLGARRLGW